MRMALKKRVRDWMWFIGPGYVRLDQLATVPSVMLRRRKCAKKRAAREKESYSGNDSSNERSIIPIAHGRDHDRVKVARRGGKEAVLCGRCPSDRRAQSVGRCTNKRKGGV